MAPSDHKSGINVMDKAFLHFSSILSCKILRISSRNVNWNVLVQGTWISSFKHFLKYTFSNCWKAKLDVMINMIKFSFASESFRESVLKLECLIYDLYQSNVIACLFKCLFKFPTVPKHAFSLHFSSLQIKLMVVAGLVSYLTRGPGNYMARK